MNNLKDQYSVVSTGGNELNISTLYFLSVVTIIAVIAIAIIVYLLRRQLGTLQKNTDILIHDHEQRLTQMYRRIEEIDEKLENTENAAELTARVNVLTKDLDVVKEDVQTQRNDIVGVQSDVSTLKTDTSTNRKDIDTLNTKLNESIDTLLTNVDKLSEDTAQVQSNLEETIKTFEGTLDVVTKDVSKLKERVDGHDTTFSDHDKSIVLLESDVEAIKNTDIPTLQGRVTANEKAINELQNGSGGGGGGDDYEALEKRVTVNETSIVSLTEADVKINTKLTTHDTVLEDLRKTDETLTARIAVNENNIDKLETFDTAIENRVSTNETTIESIDGRLDTLKTTVDAFDERLRATEDTVKTFESAVTTNTANITALTTKTEELTSTDDMIKSDVNAVKSNLNTLTTRVGANETAIKSINTKMTDIETDVSTFDGRLTRTETDLGTVVGDLSTLTTHVQTHETDIVTLKDNDTKQDKRLNDLETSLETTQAKVTVVEGDVSTAKEDIVTLKTTTAKTSQDLDTLTDRVQTVETTVTVLDKDVDVLQTDVTTLKTDVEKWEGVLTSVNSILVDTTNRVGVLEPRVQTLISESATMQEIFSIVKSKVEANGELLQRTRTRMNRHNTRITALETQLPADTISSIRADIEKNTTDLGTIVGRVDKLETTTADHETRVTQNEIKIADNVTSIGKLTTDLDKLSTDTTSSLDTLRGRITDTNNYMAQIDVRVAKNTTNVETCNTEIAALKTRLTTNENKTIANETNIETLNGRVTVNETKIVSINDEIDTLKERVTGDETRIVTLETNYTNLEKRVTDDREHVDTNFTETNDRVRNIETVQLPTKVDVYETDKHINVSVLNDPVPVGQFILAHETAAAATNRSLDVMVGLNLLIDLQSSELLSRECVRDFIGYNNKPWLTTKSDFNDNRRSWTSKYNIVAHENNRYKKLLFVGLNKRMYILSNTPRYYEDIADENDENFGTGGGSCYMFMFVYNVVLKRTELICVVMVSNEVIDRRVVYQMTDYVPPVVYERFYARAYTTIKHMLNRIENYGDVYNVDGTPITGIAKLAFPMMILGEFGCHDIQFVVSNILNQKVLGIAPIEQMPSIIDSRFGYCSMYGMVVSSGFCESISLRSEFTSLPTNNRQTLFADLKCPAPNDTHVPVFTIDETNWAMRHYNDTITSMQWERPVDNLYGIRAPVDVTLLDDTTMSFEERPFTTVTVNGVHLNNVELFPGYFAAGIEPDAADDDGNNSGRMEIKRKRIN